MTLDYQTLIAGISQFFWPCLRLGGLMISMPVLSSPVVPARIRLVFVLSLAALCAVFIPSHYSLLDFQGIYLVYVVQEVFLGLLMGFVLQMVFQVFIIGGQIVAMQAGLGFATMMDPASKASVPLVSQFYLMLVTLVFLSINGHLALFAAVIDSFRQMPIGQAGLENATVWRVILFSGWMMKESVLVAIPAIMSLLLVSLSFGVMSKVAPQMNLFSIGFPLTLILGVLIIRVTLPGVAAQIDDSLEQGMQVIIGLVR